MKQKNIKEILNVKPDYILFLIVIFGLILRLIFFVGIGFNDDSYYLEYAGDIYNGKGFLPSKYVQWSARIGVFLPVALMWRLFSINEFSTSVFFLFCSLGSVFITYLIGKELFNKKVGLISAFLLSIFPLDVVYATQVGPDIPFQFFSSLALFLFIKFEKIKKNSNLYSFFSGVSLGISYLFKEMIPVLLFLIGFYSLYRIIINKKNILNLFKKKALMGYILLIVGFLLIFSLQILYFYKITGQLFFGEKARKYAFTHDRNSNSDLKLYPLAMFNLDKNRFEWIHSKPLFGFMYYFVVFSVIYSIFSRKIKDCFFVIVWLMTFFLFFEFLLQFFCTRILDYCLYARHNRFLSTISIPAVILIAVSLDFGKNKHKKLFSFLGLLFLLITSLYYTNQSHIFLRNGMGYVRETAYFLKSQPLKTIYIPDGWTISKFKYFFDYNETLINSLKVYECGFINCTDDYYNSGNYIRDSYVIVFVNPYNYINEHSYPDFMKKPPEGWILLKNINFFNFGIFSKFNPKIFYAPK